MLDIVRTLPGSPPFLSAPPPAFSPMREVVFYPFIHPSLQFHSLSLPYSRSLLFFPFLKSESLCDSIFSSPLLCCAHCHTGSKNGVVAVSLVLRKLFGAVAAANLNFSTVLFYLGPVSMDISVCALLLGFSFFFWLMPKVAELRGCQCLSDSAWVGKARKTPLGAKNSPI